MALTYKQRKKWSLVILLIWMPLFIVLSVSVINWLYPDPLNRPHFLVELGIFVGLGLICFLPFKRIFLGIGQPDPDAPKKS